MGSTRAILYVLSGTGNSLQCARWVAQDMPETENFIVPVEASAPHLHKEHNPELSGLFLPTHGFTAPWKMLKFAAGLPQGNGRDAFVVCTRGSVKLGPLIVPGACCSALFVIALLVLLRGYRIRGLVGIDMPSNWMSLHSGQRMETRRLISDRARVRVKRFAAAIRKGDRRCFTADNLREFLSGVALFPVSFLYLLVGRFFLAKLFFANNDCNGCGLCVARCPIHAVIMRGKKHPRPYWTFSCESCMRCMGYCPKNAVEAGHSWGVVLYLLTTIPVSMYVFVWLTGLIPGIAALDSGPARLVLHLAYIYPALYLAYRLFDILLRVPVINALFTHTTLTHWYRRYHHPDIPPQEIAKAIKTSFPGD